MLKIGITGGIGSGKSTVCKLFEELGIPIYNADERAKYLMQHEHYLIDEIKKTFGEEIYPDGKLNREALAQKVFKDEKKLALLNSMVHPAVFRDTERWIREQEKHKVPYIVKEAALLVESGSYKKLDKLIVVTAPLESRIARIKKRDNVTKSKVMDRIRHQLPEEEKIKLADFVIWNDNGMEKLKEQVVEIHKKLLNNHA